MLVDGCEIEHPCSSKQDARPRSILTWVRNQIPQHTKSISKQLFLWLCHISIWQKSISNKGVAKTLIAGMQRFLPHRDIRSARVLIGNCRRRIWPSFQDRVQNFRYILLLMGWNDLCLGAYVPINPAHKPRNVAIGQKLSFGDPFSRSSQSRKSTPGPGMKWKKNSQFRVIWPRLSLRRIWCRRSDHLCWWQVFKGRYARCSDVVLRSKAFTYYWRSSSKQHSRPWDIFMWRTSRTRASILD